MAMLDDDEDDDRADDGMEVTGKKKKDLADILATLLEDDDDDEKPRKKKNTGSTDDISPLELLRLEMERDRIAEERRARADNKKMMLQLVSVAMPLLVNLFKKEVDPMMLKMLESVMSGSNNREHFAQVLQLSNEANANQMRMAIESMTKVASIKDDLIKESLEKAKENNAPPSGGAAEMIREVRLAMQALSVSGGAEKQSAHALEVLQEGEKEDEKKETLKIEAKPVPPILVVMRSIMRIHQDEKLTAGDRAKMKAGIVATILQDEELAAAIDDEDQDKIMELCAPAVGSDPNLAKWIQIDGVAYWLTNYMNKQIVPMVQEALIEGDDDDEEDGTLFGGDENNETLVIEEDGADGQNMETIK